MADMEAFWTSVSGPYAANGLIRFGWPSETSELYKDWNDTCKPNFEAFVEADMQVIPSPP